MDVMMTVYNFKINLPSYINIEHYYTNVDRTGKVLLLELVHLTKRHILKTNEFFTMFCSIFTMITFFGKIDSEETRHES
jgi:hypothetical protein